MPDTKTLDPVWVDQILVTAFDGQYGGCWYWINEDDAIRLVRIHDDGNDKWTTVDLVLAQRQEATEWGGSCTLDESRTVLTITADALAQAIAKIRADWSKTGTAEQIENAIQWETEVGAEQAGGPDLDAEAADFIVQVAVFGELVYG